MTRPDPAAEDPSAGEPPTWAGAPGFRPELDADDRDEAPDARPAAGTAAPRRGYQEAPDTVGPHAPMPGSPPYPAPAAVAPTAPRTLDETPFPKALGAAAVWLVVTLLLALVLYGSVGSFAGVGVLVGFTLVVGLVTWFIARRRPLVFWQLALIAAPIYWIARIVLFPRQM